MTQSCVHRICLWTCLGQKKNSQRTNIGPQCILTFHLFLCDAILSFRIPVFRLFCTWQMFLFLMLTVSPECPPPTLFEKDESIKTTGTQISLFCGFSLWCVLLDQITRACSPEAQFSRFTAGHLPTWKGHFFPYFILQGQFSFIICVVTIACSTEGPFWHGDFAEVECPKSS